MHQKGHIQDDGIPFELARLLYDFHIVYKVIKLLKVKKVSTQCFPVTQTTSDTNRLLIPPTQARTPSNSRVPPSRMSTVKIGDDRFLDFHIDSVE